MNITAKSNGREQASAYMLKLDIDTYKCTAVRGLGESEWWTHVWVADWCFYMQICNRICMLTWLFVVFLHLYQCAVVRSDGKWTSQAYTASCPLLMRCRCVRIILFGSVMILVCYRRLLRTILYLCISFFIRADYLAANLFFSLILCDRIFCIRTIVMSYPSNQCQYKERVQNVGSNEMFFVFWIYPMPHGRRRRSKKYEYQKSFQLIIITLLKSFQTSNEVI